MPIYLHAAKIRKAAHKTESQRSKEKHPAEGVQRPHSPPEYGQRGQYGQTPAALRLYKHTGTRGKQRKRKSKQPQPTRNKPPPDMDKYRQRGQTPDVWRREDRPRAVLLPVCSVCPLRRYICKTRGVSCSRRQTPRRVEKRRPPRAVLLPRVHTRPVPFVQQEAKARKPQQYTTRRTRGRKYSSHPPKGGDLTHSYKKSVSRRGRY